MNSKLICNEKCLQCQGSKSISPSQFNETSALKDKCGVFGVLAHDTSRQVSKLTYMGLLALQHRGQEAAGLSVVNGTNTIYTYKDLGLVSEVLTPKILSSYWGNVSIGHVRYGTAGTESADNAQPYFFKSNHTSFSLAFNGNIVNYELLKKEFMKKGRIFTSDADTEIIAQIIASELVETNNFVEAIKNTSKYLDGAYSLIILTNTGELYGVRDPTGFKPLCYGQFEDEDGCTFDVIASETCALDILGAKHIGDVKAGEIIHTALGEKIRVIGKIPNEKYRKAICMFEYVYFARPDSYLDGVSVETARHKLGMNLARSNPVDSDNAVIVPVPDSGRSASLGFSQVSGIQYVEGLMKNRYVNRTFIQPGQEKRLSLVRQKLNPVKSSISGKEVILIDDSIVRGTTTAFIVKMLKQAGAKKVHVRISCPPVIEPCYMGIDFPTKGELIAGKEQLRNPEGYVERIREKIGADSLGYQTIDGLVKSIGLGKDKICMACLNGDYPVKSDLDKLALDTTFNKLRNRN
ncbi:MAG: amidophosphoribosyltransferase [Promethearchaeota archaeon]|nr:MAG: amidophosphoribosyltransferase [Candidatus Lokiarchaeota archaeon]